MMTVLFVDIFLLVFKCYLKQTFTSILISNLKFW